MKASDLVNVWASPDNSGHTAKQYSFRLPIHVAAKLAALEDVYPSRKRTQLVGDLLATAINEVEKNLPSIPGALLGHDPDTHEEIFEKTGPIARYRTLATKYLSEIEREMGNKRPDPLFPAGS